MVAALQKEEGYNISCLRLYCSYKDGLAAGNSDFLKKQLKIK